jgi:hypothetical protein
VVTDHGRVFAQDDRDLLSRQCAPVERAKVSQLARRSDQAMAEIVLTAGVELHVRRQRAAILVEESHQAAEMIEMAVADNQGVNLLHVDAHDAHVVDEDVGRVTVIEHQGAGLVAALGFEPERQAPLGVNHIGKPGREGGRLHAHTIDRAGAQEKIVGGIDEHLNR